MKVLFIGDIFAKPGLKVCQAFLADYADDYDFIIANGENSAGGFGLTRKHFEQLLDWGVDVVTLGNHSWDQREVMTLLEETPRLIRPLNYPSTAPGSGYTQVRAKTGEAITVVQVMGRIFMEPLDCPFIAMDNMLEFVPEGQACIVDFHAEATSEKKVMGHHLAGRVSAVIGTHTHVQTADELIKKGTAYITDVGMTGVQDSSIGMRFEEVHTRFVKKVPARYRPADKAGTLCALELDIEASKTVAVSRFQWQSEDAYTVED